MKIIAKLHEFHSTTPGYVVFSLIELVVAYGFASLAIDRGNFLWYFLALVFLIGALQNLVTLIGKLIHGRQ